jgi:hypothetical protein
MLGVKVSRRVESGSFVDMGHSLIIYVIGEDKGIKKEFRGSGA